MAGLLIPFFFVQFVPFLSLAGLIGLMFLKFAIPFMVIRWWIRFGRLKTADPDFSLARNTASWVSAVAVLVLGIVRSHLSGLTL